MEKYIKVINIIDKSGSMYSILDTAISGFNGFLAEQKTVEGDALVSTVMFSNKYNVLYEDVDIQECGGLSRENYVPGGTTAMYDAIGKTIQSEIDKLGNLPISERPEKTLCVILTDGQENSSHIFKQSEIKETIEEMKKDFNWEFIFLAANQDASLSAQSMGISKGNSFSFAATDGGLKSAYTNISNATSTYRSSSATSMDNLMGDAK